MNAYAREAKDLVGYISLIELADGGMLTLSSLDRDLVTSLFGIEDLVFVSLDIDSCGRSPPFGERQFARDTAGLQFYYGQKLFNPDEDIHFVECFSSADVCRKFIGSKVTTSLGGQVNHWMTELTTKDLRVQVLLSVGGCYNAVTTPRNNARPKEVEAGRHFGVFYKEVIHLHHGPHADPKPLASERFSDSTLDLDAENLRAQVDYFGYIRYNN